MDLQEFRKPKFEIGARVKHSLQDGYDIIKGIITSRQYIEDIQGELGYWQYFVRWVTENTIESGLVRMDEVELEEI